MKDQILIVDDEQEMCSLLVRRLAKEGYSCVTANSGREALSHFYNGTFSLVISDIHMPEMDGLGLLKRLKEISPKVMVIVVTGYPQTEVAVEAMRLGGYDFIIKPIDLDLVTLSVKRALEKKRLEEEVEAHHRNLEKLVEERTEKLHQAYRILKKAHMDSVKVLIEAIEAKDPYTRGHVDRVRKLSLSIAIQLGFPEERLEVLEFGALLHDIGKIGIRDGVLQKPGLLSPEEFRHIREHPLIGVKILEGINFFRDKLSIVRCHHEHLDGSGYPDGLAGMEIPLEARIIAVADAFDAMTSSRPHRKAIPLEDVLRELDQEKGKQFDPDILDVFLRKQMYRY